MISCVEKSATYRRRRRFAIGAMLLLVGWLFAFSVHVHSAQDDVGHGSNGTAHLCQICAAFPAAAGPPAQALLNTPDGTPLRVAVTSVSLFGTAPFSSYRSRAPPGC